MKPKQRSTEETASARPTHEQITRLAHTLWLEEGKPSGREMHHWLEAERQLIANGGSREKESTRINAAGETRREIEADKRVDGLGPISRDPRTPKGERL